MLRGFQVNRYWNQGIAAANNRAFIRGLPSVRRSFQLDLENHTSVEPGSIVDRDFRLEHPVAATFIRHARPTPHPQPLAELRPTTAKPAIDHASIHPKRSLPADKRNMLIAFGLQIRS